jgi:hypothetical protein
MSHNNTLTIIVQGRNVAYQLLFSFFPRMTKEFYFYVCSEKTTDKKKKNK